MDETIIANNTRIAVLETNMTTIAKDIVEIKSEIKAISVLLQKQPSLELEIMNLSREMDDIKKNNFFWKWFGPTLTGIICTILSSAITYLIIFYLQNIK